MAEVARFFDTVSYGETDQAEVQSRFRPDGVIYEADANRLAVASPGGMFISVMPGEAMVEGFHYKNTAVKVLAIAANTSGATRIDRVVLRLNRIANSLTAEIVQGTPGAGTPGLTQVAGGVWELALATVTVANGTLAVTSAMITDARTYGNIIHNSAEIGLASVPSGFAGIQRRVLTADVSGNLYFDDNAAGRRNYLDNATFRVNQRVSGSAGNSGDYASDRWTFATTNNVGGFFSGVVGVSGSLAGVGSESCNAMFFQRANNTAPATNTIVSVRQNIEGTELLNLQGMPMVLSFWAFAGKTGTYGVNVEQMGTNWKYLSTFTITLANAWQFFTIQVPWTSSGTWLTTTAGAIAVRWVAEAGATQRAATVNAWYNGVEFAASTVNNALNATNDTLYVAAPKLEVGTLATRWEAMNYATELQRAYRYLYVEQAGGLVPSFVYSTTQIISMMTFPVQMRVTPSMAPSQTPVFTNGGAPAINGISNICNGQYTTGLTYSSFGLWLASQRVCGGLLSSSTPSSNISASQAGLMQLGSALRLIYSAEP
jgi:hypothetical protein